MEQLTLKQTLDIMEREDLVVDRVLDYGELGRVIEFKREMK